MTVMPCELGSKKAGRLSSEVSKHLHGEESERVTVSRLSGKECLGL